MAKKGKSIEGSDGGGVAVGCHRSRWGAGHHIPAASRDRWSQATFYVPIYFYLIPQTRIKKYS